MHGDENRRRPAKRIADVPHEFNKIFDILSDEQRKEIFDWLYDNGYLLIVRKKNLGSS